MKSSRRVVITGLGVIAPNGNGTKDFEAALRATKSGIRHNAQMAELNFACQVAGSPQGIEELQKQHFTPDELPGMNLGITYTALSALEAFKDAGLAIPERNADWCHEDTGAILGTGIGGMDTFADFVYPTVASGKVKRLGSTVVERIMASAVSAKVGGMLGLGNQVTTNSSACSTGTEALIMGADRIRAGFAERMLVGGAEAAHPHVWSGFDSMKVLCRKYNETPEKASRPMSESAGGFVPGGGAGVLVIESLEAAQKRGARIYAEVLGTAINSGGMRAGGSMTAPSPKGVQRCVRTALTHAGIESREIDYINGHLTATMADPLEISNWSQALELPKDRFPVINSTKSLIGHALGASGAIECIATILQLTSGFVHGSANCEDVHPDIAPFGKSIVHETVHRDLKIAAKASFGFGDVNSCIIFKKWGT